jgi:hypothetical protein
MDPYLEDPAIWPDFHNRLAERISEDLNQKLPEPYYAQLETREEIGISDEPVHRVIVPDVSVRKQAWEGAQTGGGVAVAEPRSELSEYVELIVETELAELSFVEIRDAHRGHEVVTLIEVLSPANKRPGTDRDKFLQKRSEVLESHTSLVEIDLLRNGDRAWTDPVIAHKLFALEPPPHYLVTVNREWQRRPDLKLQVFPAYLNGCLPVIPVPLREGEQDVLIDLQHVFLRVYEAGPYRRGAVNYSQPPNPALPVGWLEWAAERVAARQGR